MRKSLITVLFIAFAVSLFAQKDAYKIFSKEGKGSSYDKMIKSLKEADIVLFGELHNNPICHWLELEVAKDLYDEQSSLILGAEMFESDDQIVLDEYLKGDIKHKHFKTEAKMWNNYDTDYKPLIKFAKDSNLKFVGTNIPRRYANYVARKGIDSLKNLSPEAKEYIAPLPIQVDLELPCYKMFVDMQMGHGSEMTPTKMAEAQASKDATMAYFILKYYKKGSTFVHYNGSYHSDNFESIFWYLKKENKNLKIVTIATTTQGDITLFDEEMKGAADFILVIPESMTTTY